MCEEFTHTLNYPEAFSLSIFRRVIALKQSVLLLEIIIFLHVVERVLVAIWNMICKPKHSRVKLFSMDYGNFVTRLNFINFHEFLREDISAHLEFQIIHTVEIYFRGAGELLLVDVATVLLIAPNLKWSVYF